MPEAMFHIIGVAHRVQAKPKGAADSQDQKEFRTCLSLAIEQMKPAVVGEEFSDYALRRLREERGMDHESLTKEIADSFKVEHRFCDPDAETRMKMGYIEGSQLALQLATGDNPLSNAEINDRGFAIEVAKYWPLREQFWFVQLRDVQDKEVIFVCGDVHVESFRELLKKNNVPSTVLSRRFGITQADDNFWNRTLGYLKTHPELRN